MKNSMLIFFLILAAVGAGMAQGAIEQYCYVRKTEGISWVPVINMESRKGWYVEARYNYEETKTFSAYVGKTFSKHQIIGYTIIPMLGVVTGKFNGGSTGFHGFVEFQKFFFSSQTQYTFSVQEQAENFFFTWSELGYQPWKWFRAGLSAQHTCFTKSMASVSEPGVVLGFTFGEWNFPLYCFRPTSSTPYVVLGVNRNIRPIQKNK